MHDVFWVLVCFIIVGIQRFLSTRNNIYWGGILPTLYLIGFIWIISNKEKVPTPLILAVLGGLVILLGGWTEGRESLKRKRKKELEKMKTMDIQ